MLAPRPSTQGARRGPCVTSALPHPNDISLLQKTATSTDRQRNRNRHEVDCRTEESGRKQFPVMAEKPAFSHLRLCPLVGAGMDVPASFTSPLLKRQCLSLSPPRNDKHQGHSALCGTSNKTPTAATFQATCIPKICTLDIWNWSSGTATDMAKTASIFQALYFIINSSISFTGDIIPTSLRNT